MRIAGYEISKVKKDLSKPDYFGFDGSLDDNYFGFDSYNTIFSSVPRYQRSQIYQDVDFIDAYDEEVSKFLSDAASDATQFSTQTNATVWCSSKDDNIKTEINKLFQRLGINENSTTIVRSMIKYGDKFGRLIIDPKTGVKSIKLNIHPSQIIRLEDGGTLVGFHKQYEEVPLERYEMIHWMLPSEFVEDDLLLQRAELEQTYFIDKDPTYGFSDLFRIIQTSKRLKYVEDALIIGRLAKSKYYRLHYVEVGKSTATERVNVMRRYVKNFKKNQSQDYNQNTAFSEANSFSYEEDRYFPVSEGKGNSNINEIGGDMDIQGIVDVEYLAKKRNRILGIPENDDSMTNRLQQDTKYARRIAAYQRAFLKGLYQLCDIHLDLKGMYSADRKYTLNIVDVDAFVQTERYDLLLASVDFVERVMTLSELEGIQVNRTYLFKYLISNYLKFPNLDIDRLYNEMDQKLSKLDGTTDFIEDERAGDNLLEQVNNLIQTDSISRKMLKSLQNSVNEALALEDTTASEFVKSNSEKALRKQ